MGKQKKQLILIFLVLIILILCYAGLKYYQSIQPPETEEQTEHTVVAINTDAITKLEVINEQGGFTFEKKGDNWINVADTIMNLDSDSVENMLATVQNLTSKDLIAKPSSLSEYGLEEPVLMITIHTSSESAPKKIIIGDYNEMTASYYLMIDGDDQVYMTNSTFYSSWNQTADFFQAVEQTETEIETN